MKRYDKRILSNLTDRYERSKSDPTDLFYIDGEESSGIF